MSVKVWAILIAGAGAATALFLWWVLEQLARDL
jgi:hypothetical protein